MAIRLTCDVPLQTNNPRKMQVLEELGGMARRLTCDVPLQTNNPRKMQVLEELGVDVTGRIPCIVESQELNVGYLATKQVRSRPWLLSCTTI